MFSSLVEGRDEGCLQSRRISGPIGNFTLKPPVVRVYAGQFLTANVAFSVTEIRSYQTPPFIHGPVLSNVVLS